MRTAPNTKKAFVALALAAATGLAAANGPDRLDKRQQFTGRTTVYIAETGNEGACGGMLSNGGMTVALNSNQWDGGSHCGQQLTINYQGRSVTVTVRDQCPGCPWGSLDLTPGAWSAVTGGAAWGEAYTSWSWGSGNSGGNNGGGNNNQQTTSTTPKWTPPATSTTPKWTPPATQEKPSTTWTPPSSSRTSTTSSSTWIPPTTSSSSTAPSSSSSSSSSSSISSSAAMNATSSAGNTTALSTALGDLVTTTLSFDNGTHTTATLAIESGVTSTLTAPIAGSTAHGALGQVNQVVLQMANIIVNAVEADQ